MSSALRILALLCVGLLQYTQGVPAPYEVLSCKSFKRQGSTGQYLQDASHGSWPASGFCRAIKKTSLPAGHHFSYKVSAMLLNVRGKGGVNYGHPGLAYNALDANNFDFVYFRPHSVSGCFQTGYVRDGTPIFSGAISSSCPSGPPKGGKWFSVQVEVYGPSAKVYLNNKLLREVRTHYSPHGRGGIIVANGYANVIKWKNLNFKALSGPYPYQSMSCIAEAKMPGYYLLDASHGSWPVSGFCRTLLPGSLPGSQYIVSAKLFNYEGNGRASFGHPGVMYNAQDINNFDFVYFRPHSKSGCFQTGYVQRGKPIFTGAVSGSCQNGPPRGRTWFDVRIVIQGRRAEIYLDNAKVATVTTHYPPKARGGIIVANGYKNIISFKSFKLQRLPDLFPFPSRACRAVLGKSGFPRQYELDAVHGRWPADGFCRTLIPSSFVLGSNYKVSALLYNKQGWKGPNSGHLGLMYNARDINNFEFVYFRLHSVSGCYQTGYVVNGVPKFDGKTVVSKPCVNRPPVGQTWFKAEVRVQGGTAKIYKDHALIGTLPTRSSPIPRGGVIVANGYQNVIFFKQYQLRPLVSPLPFISKQCARASAKGALYQLHGNSLKWPGSGFCRAFYRDTVPGSRYTMSVDLFNVQGFSGKRPGVGHPGIMYNVKDINNFDFVYFRPHSTGGCFQTGYVINNVVHTTTSSTCPQGPPPRKVWFNVKVVVTSSSVRIYRDGGLVVQTTSGFLPTLGRGGVIVANGYRNIVNFRNYKIIKNK